MQGSKVSIKYQGLSLDATARLDYINIPVLANVYVAEGLAIKVGVQPGFSVNDKYHFKINADGKTSKLDTDAEAKKFDFAIPIGISYELNNIVFEGRYNWGLKNIWNDSASKNRVLQITFGYKFDL